MNLNKKDVFAVVGASEDNTKYGHKIFEALLKNGYNAYPINPNAKSVLNKKTYKSISLMPEKPDIVITVVKPEVTEKIADEAVKIGVKKIWMQPGSESKEAIKTCKENGISCTYNSCIIIDGLKIKF